MKIRKLNESIEDIKKRLDTLDGLRNIVVNAESDMMGVYGTSFADPTNNLKEINREFNDIIIRLRKFERLLGEEIDKI